MKSCLLIDQFQFRSRSGAITVKLFVCVRVCVRAGILRDEATLKMTGAEEWGGKARLHDLRVFCYLIKSERGGT